MDTVDWEIISLKDYKVKKPGALTCKISQIGIGKMAFGRGYEDA